MQQKTVTFRAPGDKIKALDKLATLQQRDRSFVLNEAVDQYLAFNEYNIAVLKEGIRQDNAGEHVSHEEVGKLVASLVNRPAKRAHTKAKA